MQTKALRQCGGLGAELAEDHSTTLIMNANGWRGVHAIDAIAHGDGPRTFADLATQEFQWSRSLVTILLQCSPALVRRLSPKLKFQFLFSQLWYPLFSLSMAIMFALPIIALLSGRNFVSVSYPDFLVRFVPISTVLVLMALGGVRENSATAYDAKVLSWEGTLFLFARWPMGLHDGRARLGDRVLRRFPRDTKGQWRGQPLPLQWGCPYAILALISALPPLLVKTQEPPGASTPSPFSMPSCAPGLFFAIVLLRGRECASALRGAASHPGAGGDRRGLLLLPAVATATRGPAVSKH